MKKFFCLFLFSLVLCVISVFCISAYMIAYATDPVAVFDKVIFGVIFLVAILLFLAGVVCSVFFAVCMEKSTPKEQKDEPEQKE